MLAYTIQEIFSFLKRKFTGQFLENQLMCEGFGLWPQAGLLKLVRRGWCPLLIFMPVEQQFSMNSLHALHGNRAFFECGKRLVSRMQHYVQCSMLVCGRRQYVNNNLSSCLNMNWLYVITTKAVSSG